MSVDDLRNWPADMKLFAAQWLAEMRDDRPDDDRPIADAVVAMNFLAPPATQWEFLLAAVDLAENDAEFAAIAAGPFEHLLGSHGKDYIDAVERQAGKDSKFARMTTDSWRHLMSDDVWERVQTIQRAADDSS